MSEDVSSKVKKIVADHLGIDEAKVRNHLLETYNLEIGAGLGALAGKAWRIGLMGYGARPENVALCLRALEESLTE